MKSPLSKRVTKIIVRIIRCRKRKKNFIKRSVMTQTEFDEANIYNS